MVDLQHAVLEGVGLEHGLHGGALADGDHVGIHHLGEAGPQHRPVADAHAHGPEVPGEPEGAFQRGEDAAAKEAPRHVEEVPAAAPAGPEGVGPGAHPAQEEPLQDQDGQDHDRRRGQGQQRQGHPEEDRPGQDRLELRHRVRPQQEDQGREDRQGEAQGLPEHPVEVADQGGVMGEAAVKDDHLAAGQLEGRVAEPGGAGAHGCSIGHGADAQQEVLRQGLARQDDRVVAQERVASQHRVVHGHGAAVDPGATQVDAVSKEGLGADGNQLGHHIDDGAELAAGADAHARQPQPEGPEEGATEPLARGVHQPGLEPDPQVGRAPAPQDAGLHRTHGLRCQGLGDEGEGHREHQQSQREG